MLDLEGEGTTVLAQLHSITSWTTQFFLGTAVRTPNLASLLIQINEEQGGQGVIRGLEL